MSPLMLQDALRALDTLSGKRTSDNYGCMHCSDEELAQGKAFIKTSRRDTLPDNWTPHTLPPCGVLLDDAYYMPALLSAYLEDGRDDVVEALDSIAAQHPWTEKDYGLLGRVFSSALAALPPYEPDLEIAIGPMEILHRAAAFGRPFDAVVDVLLTVKMNGWLWCILHELRRVYAGGASFHVDFDVGRVVATDRMRDALAERFFEVADSDASRARDLSAVEAYLKSLR